MPTDPKDASMGNASGTIPDDSGVMLPPADNGGAPPVVEAPPTISADALAPGPDAAIPAPPGRPAPGTPVGTMLAAGVPQPATAATAAPQAPAPDPASIQNLAEQIAPQLRDAIADTLNVAAETVQEGATHFAPMVAKQALLEASGDPTTAARAKTNRRHLWGQVLMTAAANGIPLQQRHEQRVLGVFTTILTTAIALATRAATGGIA